MLYLIKKENVIIISEKDYNEMLNFKKNTEYFACWTVG